jgi:exopolyphosphatase/guanosine-5'-triphosphate,3'-diphosphate pyrophosphatase
LRSDGRISSGAATRLQNTLTDFGKIMTGLGARRAWAVATSALRDAANREQVLAASQAALGVPVDVITGELEASLTLAGVQAGVGKVSDGVVLDIGGGSTELIRVHSGESGWYESMDEGVVHLIDEYVASDPPQAEEIDSVRKVIRHLVEGLPEDGGSTLAATAGTPTTLAALDLAIDEYDPTLVNGHVLSRVQVARMAERLFSISSTERLRLPGMEPGRQDLIVAGTIMVEEVMDRWGYEEMVVSDWGLLEGVALAAAKGKGSRID